jgi:translation initiation factor 6
VPVGRTLITGSPYLGVYLRVSDQAAIVPPVAPVALEREVERLLNVPTIRTTVAASEIVGALVAVNSHGAVVSDAIDSREQRRLEERMSVTPVSCRQNAIGNNVLANDHGALVHPDLSDAAVGSIRRALDVPTERGTVAGLGTVGMAAIATNRGVVAHPRTTDEEAARITSLLRVPVHRSTANFGVPIVGACLVANSRALLVGKPTTPVEIVHLQEGLQILD